MTIRITAQGVLTIPTFDINRNSGTTRAVWGIMTAPRMIAKMSRLPRKSYFASAYPAMVENSAAPMPAVVAYMMVLSSHRENIPPWKLKTCLKFSNSLKSLANQRPNVVKRSLFDFDADTRT